VLFYDMSKGEKTKVFILDTGLTLAGEHGLEGVSIGLLAKVTGMSKSGLFAHFNSKENLQLAILSYAAEDFLQQVIVPATKVTRGIPRILALVDNWVSWSDNMSGGCIFASAGTEFSERPGKVRDLLFKQQQLWLNSIVRVAESAISENYFNDKADLDQFAFELYSFLLGINSYRQMLHDPEIEIKKEKALLSLLSRYVKPEVKLENYL